jgi:U6 snRNA-associated Sm-like protein LSm8
VICGLRHQGTLKGFDQAVNVILAGCHERVFSETEGVDRVPLGLYLIRGDNMQVSQSGHFAFIGA